LKPSLSRRGGEKTGKTLLVDANEGPEVHPERKDTSKTVQDREVPSWNDKKEGKKKKVLEEIFGQSGKQ